MHWMRIGLHPHRPAHENCIAIVWPVFISRFVTYHIVSVVLESTRKSDSRPPGILRKLGKGGRGKELKRRGFRRGRGDDGGVLHAVVLAQHLSYLLAGQDRRHPSRAFFSSPSKIWKFWGHFSSYFLIIFDQKVGKKMRRTTTKSRSW